MIESVMKSNAKHAAIRRFQWFTIGWMTIEVVIALAAAIRAHSVVLAAFGADSTIELLSAAVVLARFRAIRGISETLATKITGWLLVALVAYIALYLACCTIEPRTQLFGYRAPGLFRGSHALAGTAQKSARDCDQ